LRSRQTPRQTTPTPAPRLLGSTRTHRLMPDDALERVLRLVAEGRLTAAGGGCLRLVRGGRLTADEAGPILDALDDRAGSERGAGGASGSGSARQEEVITDANDLDPARTLRVEVTDGGRAVIN